MCLGPTVSVSQRFKSQDDVLKTTDRFCGGSVSSAGVCEYLPFESKTNNLKY